MAGPTDSEVTSPVSFFRRVSLGNSYRHRSPPLSRRPYCTSCTPPYNYHDLENVSRPGKTLENLSLNPDPGVRAVRLAAAALAVFCLFAAFLAGGCASVPSNASAHSPSAPGSDPPPTVTPPPQPSISVSVAPASITVQPGQTQSFTATVAHDTQNKGVSWSLSNCGPGPCGLLFATSSASGAAVTYTAPLQMPASPSVILTATPIADPAKLASPAITIAAPPPTLP